MGDEHPTERWIQDPRQRIAVDTTVTLTPPLGFQQLQHQVADAILKTETRATARVQHEPAPAVALADLPDVTEVLRAAGELDEIAPVPAIASPLEAWRRSSLDVLLAPAPGIALIALGASFTAGMTALVPGRLDGAAPYAAAALAFAALADRDAVHGIRPLHVVSGVIALAAFGAVVMAAMAVGLEPAMIGGLSLVGGALLVALSFVDWTRAVLPLESRVAGAAAFVLGLYVIAGANTAL